MIVLHLLLLLVVVVLHLLHSITSITTQWSVSYYRKWKLISSEVGVKLKNRKKIQNSVKK